MVQRLFHSIHNLSQHQVCECWLICDLSRARVTNVITPRPKAILLPFHTTSKTTRTTATTRGIAIRKTPCTYFIWIHFESMTFSSRFVVVMTDRKDQLRWASDAQIKDMPHVNWAANSSKSICLLSILQLNSVTPKFPIICCIWVHIKYQLYVKMRHIMYTPSEQHGYFFY